MKRLLFVILGVALTVTTAQSKQWDSLRVAVDAPYPPFAIVKPDGTLSGFEIELGDAVCQEITGQDCDWVQQAWDGIIPGLIARKFDMIFSSMAIREDRKKSVLFSVPYYTTPSTFFARKSEDFDPGSAKGKHIGVQRATNQDRYVTEFLPEAEIVRYTSNDDMVLDLASERLDAIFIDAPVGLELLADETEVVQIGEMIKQPERIFGQGVGAAFRHRSKELEQAVSAALEKLKNNGTYDRIMKKYFDIDIKI